MNKKPGRDSMKETRRTGLAKVIEGQVQVKFQLAQISFKFGESKLDVVGVSNKHEE